MKKNFSIAVVITFLVLVAGFLFPGPFQTINSKITDLFFNIRGPIPTQNSVVIVAIDEKSVNKIGRWPWPRSIMAKLVENLAQDQPKGLGFDITFSEPTGEDVPLANALKKLPNAYLGYFFYTTPEEMQSAGIGEKEIGENDKSIFGARLAESSKQSDISGRKVFGVQTNVPPIAQSLETGHQGFFNVFPDTDGVIRKSLLLLTYKKNLYPSLGLQMAGVAKDFSPIPLLDPKGALYGIALGAIKIPVNPSGEIYLNYRGAGKTFPHLSAVDVLENKVNPDSLKDKIVLIGATAIGIYDMRVTPMDPNFPGVEITANAIDNILNGDFLIQDETTKIISLALLIFTGLFLGIILPRFKALNSAFIFILFLCLLSFGCYIAFLRYHLILDNLDPFLNTVLVFGGITIHRYFTEEREKRKIKKTFQHYLSPAVIKHLLEHPEQLHLGGDRKELTVLFSDIRGFTSASEKMPPEKLVQLLNDYFTVMTEVIFQYEGTLDKYMGDAIMAVFGAPLEQKDHPLRAALTALEMADKLKLHKKEWCQKYGIDDLQIGIGLHTGTMVVGNMGSEKRFNYTVVGDNVNLASRLEGLNKDYGTQIIISEEHYEKVKDFVKAKKLGEVKVKGKEKPTTIYELLSKMA